MPRPNLGIVLDPYHFTTTFEIYPESNGLLSDPLLPLFQSPSALAWTVAVASFLFSLLLPQQQREDPVKNQSQTSPLLCSTPFQGCHLTQRKSPIPQSGLISKPSPPHLSDLILSTPAIPVSLLFLEWPGLRDFSLAISSGWSTLHPDICVPHSPVPAGLYSNAISSVRPSWI